MDVFGAGKYVFDVNAFHNSPPEGFEDPSQLQSMSQGNGTESQVIMRTVTSPAPPMSPSTSDSVDGLVQRLRNLHVNDPEYANTYARLVSIIPRLAGGNTFQGDSRTPCLFCKHQVNIHLARNCPIEQGYLK